MISNIHRGLCIENKVGKEAVFEVIFLLVAAPAVVGGLETKAGTVVDGKGKTIPVIDRQRGG